MLGRASRTGRPPRCCSPAIVALCIAAVGAGCGDDETPEVRVDREHSYCGELAAVHCGNIFRCCTGATIEKLLGGKVSSTERDCRTDVELICRRGNHVALDAVARGTVRVDEALATSCLKSYVVAGEACFLYTGRAPWSEACKSSPFVGLVEVGGACRASVECATGGTCGLDRLCRALPGAEESCALAACAEGLYCRPGDKKCAPRGVGPCTSDLQCGDAHYCDLSSTPPLPEPGTCQPKAGNGAPCTSSKQCSSGYCLPGVCGGALAKTCFRDEECAGICESGGYGGSCSSDSQCGPGKCSGTGSYCTGSYGCPSGQSCVYSNRCIFSRCEGSPVCAEGFALVDYCSASVQVLNPAP